MSNGITQEVQASIELDTEKVSFVMPDGQTFKVELRTILEKGDTQTALAYANLVVLQNVAAKQGELAMALNAMAEAMRGLVPQQNSAAFTPDAVTGLVETVFGQMTSLFEKAGMKLPTTGE